MSAAPSSGAAPAAGSTASPDKNAPPSKDGKPAAALEEDDEFEDFPVESTFATPYTMAQLRGSAESVLVESKC